MVDYSPNANRPGTAFFYNPVADKAEVQQGQAGAAASLLYAWSPSLLMPVLLSLDASGNLNVAGGGGGGGGGPVTMIDGANVTQGALADVAVTSDAVGTVSGKLRGLVKILASAWDSVNGRLKVDGSAVTQPVSGAFFQATQPVSLASLPAIPAGSNNIGHITVDNASLAVTGSFWQTTQPISAVALPLPAGAATSGLQTTGNTALTTINGTLGSPFQAGGSIGNASFGISGTLPAFAATPTFNLGTLNGAATTALQTTGNSSLASIVTTLGTPFQAGGSVANTSFGISGTLPAFAATPTFNLGTLNGAATSSRQDTANTSLANLDVALSTRLKPADTLAKVATVDTITNTVSVAGAVSVSNFPGTQPVSAAALPLPANAAQETGGNLALLLAAGATGNASLASMDAKTPPLSQAFALYSAPVVIAPDQDTILGKIDRRNGEMRLSLLQDASAAALSRRAGERISCCDRRGSTGRGSTR